MSGITSPVKVASAGDIEDDTAVLVEVSGLPVCLARSGGKLFAVGDLCSHSDVSLSEGLVEDCTVECWLHGSRFDLATGEPLGLPATRPVPTYTVTTDGDDVFVSLEPAHEEN